MTVAAAPPKRVLVVGATGVFGGRLARHLARHGPAMDLLVSSRDGPRADALAAEIGATGLALHTGHGLAERLRTLRCFAVIDCSGPFQRLSHGTARAAVASGAHAIDLADARDYLLGYSAALDDAARAQGVAALAGASSTPALSGAVARALTAGWSRVDMLDIAITPGGRSEIGRAALEAVISCVGRDVPVWRDGRVADTTGWGDATVVDMPGLGRRRVAAVETVDAEHLGPKLGVRTRVTFRAGLESAAEQHGLELLARLRRWGWLGDPAPLLPLLLAGRRITRLPTGDHGGMRVGARGIDGDGRPTDATWSLLATHDDGPQVPTLAAAAALRALVDGRIAPGARLANDALTLDQIMAEAAPYRITTETTRRDDIAPPWAA